VAVLAQAQDPLVVVDREDHHGSRVLQHHPGERLLVVGPRAAYDVGAEREREPGPIEVVSALDRPALCDIRYLIHHSAEATVGP
jgi:hypothetical protein